MYIEPELETWTKINQQLATQTPAPTAHVKESCHPKYYLVTLPTKPGFAPPVVRSELKHLEYYCQYLIVNV